MRTAFRAVLVASTALSLFVTAMDLLEIAMTGTAQVTTIRMVRLEIGSAILTVLVAWWLGWRLL